MQKIIWITFTIIAILITSCHNNSNKPDVLTDNDQSFLQYFEKTFNEHSAIKEQMFITIPCNGCYGCEQFIYSTFTDQLMNNMSFTLIICNPDEKGFLSPTIDADNIKYDFQGKMINFEFGYGYPTCFIVKDDIVVRTFTLSPDIIYWMNEFLLTKENQTTVFE